MGPTLTDLSRFSPETGLSYTNQCLFRRPLIEAGSVDLEEAAKTNGLAAMMLRYGEGKDLSRPSPLVTAEGVPFIVATLESIEKQHGTVEAYLTTELGLSGGDLMKLKGLYVKLPCAFLPR